LSAWTAALAKYFPAGSGASVHVESIVEDGDEMVVFASYHVNLPNGEKIHMDYNVHMEWVGERVVDAEHYGDFGSLAKAFAAGKLPADEL